MSLASVSIVGNLVRAPEQMCFPSGRVKTTMVVAINNRQKAKNNSKPTETTDFYKVETWGKLAELSSKFLAKGYQVTVTGRLVMDHWTDRHGKSRVTPVVEATQVAFPPKLRVLDTPAGTSADTTQTVNPIGGELVMSDEDDEIEYEDDEDEDDDDDDYSGGYPNSKSSYKAAPQRGGPKSKIHAKLA
ncbi:MAG: single-stranded DNA-binding protein [Candidatus Obscuribacterales bacterium]|nr:single-stranded DNA-binding protein [Candidatus Obscuribacterales bacterium]